MSSVPAGLMAVGLAASAAAMSVPNRSPAVARLVRPRPARPARRSAMSAGARGVGLPAPLAAATAGLAVALLVGRSAGVVLGIVSGVVLHRVVRRLPAASERRRAATVAADLPLALNLLAACLEAGSPLGPAVGVVGTAMGGPLGRELAAVAVSLRLGSSPAHAWSRLAADPTVRPVARAVVRVSDSGAALAPMITRVAEEQRDRTRLAAEAAGRRVGVLVVAPLGLCFLPAFLLLGVAPVVIGLASLVLG
jgi:pilus assembly protein TadC